jgi:hypothetical protein
MVSSTLSLQPATLEEVRWDLRIQQWLKEKGWELVPPCGDLNCWHLELGNGNMLPITYFLLYKMYLKDHPV